MKKRFVEGFYLLEQWCYLVPGSMAKAVPLLIGNLIEQTEEYEIYEVTDCLMGFPCTIKVYLDPNVKPGGSRMLGLYGCAEIPKYDSTRKNLYVFEIIDCKENYQLVKDMNATNCCTDDTDAVQSLSCETDPLLTERTDEETGITYQVDDKGYVWEDGKNTNMWFTQDGKLIKPRTEFEEVQGGQGVQGVQEEEVVAKGFDCVVGMEELKQQLRNEVLWPMQHKELMEQYRLHPLNGMLLYGPPGCGKTYIAQKFAEESNMNFELITAADVTAHYMHQTSGRIKEMFENARMKAPCVLCIDEIDSLVPDRSQVGLESGAADVHESVNEFLSHMNNCSKDGVFVIGSTNCPYSLDPALLRTGRMDKIIYVGMPDEDSRKALLEYYLKDRPQDEDIDTLELARLADGMNASDIEFMINSVAMKAAMAQAPISFESLAEQAKTQRRSVYIPKETETEKTSPAYTKVMGFGFTQAESNKGQVKKSCA